METAALAAMRDLFARGFKEIRPVFTVEWRSCRLNPQSDRELELRLQVAPERAPYGWSMTAANREANEHWQRGGLVANLMVRRAGEVRSAIAALRR